MDTMNTVQNMELRELPTGLFNFAAIRNDNLIYVDKTARLVELIKSCRRCFLSRPRRFGKSLTVSTLEAMFSGKAELFEGLAAEEWVKEQAKHPNPVLSLDMSMITAANTQLFEMTFHEMLNTAADLLECRLKSESFGGKLRDMIIELYKRGGPVVVLIDEYDKPILDCITDVKKAEEVRAVLRSFYTVLKGCEKHLRFVMLTGISKFSKVGIFSAMNNLIDISMDTQFGDIAGYTQEELEAYFLDWIDSAAERTSMTRTEMLKQIKDYYDGFCFDGKTRLYNPFSTLCFLRSAEFRNYWYESGSPWWIVQYMKDSGIKEPDEYCHIEVGKDFTSTQEIERAPAESFLYQAGYLTIEKTDGQSLILNYSNREVHEAVSRMYLEHVYKVAHPFSIGRHIWIALSKGDIAECVRLYSTAISGIPYEDISHPNEAFFKAMFLMLLRGAGIEAKGEIQSAAGRSDIEIYMKDLVVVLEFKTAADENKVNEKAAEALKQIQAKGYARQYEDGNRRLISGAVVINMENKTASYTESA